MTSIKLNIYYTHAHSKKTLIFRLLLTFICWSCDFIKKSDHAE